MIILYFIEITFLASNKSKRTSLEHMRTSKIVFNYNLQTKICVLFYLRTNECTLTTFENSSDELRLLIHLNTQIPFKLEFKEHACSYLSKNFDLINVKNKRKLLRFFTESNDKVINKNDFIIETKPRNAVYGFKYEGSLMPIENSTFRGATIDEREKLEEDIINFRLTQNFSIGVCLPDVIMNDVSLTVFLLMKEKDRNETLSINKHFNCKFVYSANIESHLKRFFKGSSFIYSEKDIKILEKHVNWENLKFEDIVEFFKRLCESKIAPIDSSVYS